MFDFSYLKELKKQNKPISQFLETLKNKKNSKLLIPSQKI